jgi:hypothetical protein
MVSTREVKLPSDLCEKIEHLYGSQFGTLQEFLIYILQELSRNDAAQTDQAEQQIIEERLKDLGYI